MFYLSIYLESVSKSVSLKYSLESYTCFSTNYYSIIYWAILSDFPAYIFNNLWAIYDNS
jgi:hypothetical protein